MADLCLCGSAVYSLTIAGDSFLMLWLKCYPFIKYAYHCIVNKAEKSKKIFTKYLLQSEYHI